MCALSGPATAAVAVKSPAATEGASAAGSPAGGEREGAGRVAASLAPSSCPSCAAATPTASRPPAPSGAGPLNALLPRQLEDIPAWLQPFVVAALAAALAVLVVAALPYALLRPEAAAVFVDGRRAELAVAGGLLLIAVAIVGLLA